MRQEIEYILNPEGGALTANGVTRAMCREFFRPIANMVEEGPYFLTVNTMLGQVVAEFDEDGGLRKLTLDMGQEEEPVEDDYSEWSPENDGV